MDESFGAALPRPSEVLAEPYVVVRAPHELLHRVHDRRFPGNDFNPCRGPDTRFAPIQDEEGRCVPSLYAGGTVEAAIYETVFHDIPVTSPDRKTVPRGAVESRKHSTLQPRRPLRLASLRAPDLRKWQIRRESLIASPPSQYKHTALWAKAIHDQHDVDGLIWTSRQCDPDAAMLLFGDRVAAQDIRVVGVRAGTDGSFVKDVRQAGKRSGIVITL